MTEKSRQFLARFAGILACLCIIWGLSCSYLAPAQTKDILVLKGSPTAIGRQHGEAAKTDIRLMVNEYVGDQMDGEQLNQATQQRIDTMKGSLPKWYLDELHACAAAADLDSDVLLYAQCEGDVRSLPGCTTYVAFGNATPDGKVKIGRNFDYWGLDSTEECARVFVIQPSQEGHYAFVSVGWTGILGGWTLYNEKGLFVANNLGGFREKDPQGVPTLILLRIIAETAATVEEAIEIIKDLPRMRGQAIILGHAGDPKQGIQPSGAVVLYDAKRVEMKAVADGFAFHSSVGTDENTLRKAVKRRQRQPYKPIQSVGNDLTLHSVAIAPAAGTLWVAHGKRPAHEGNYVSYDLKELLNRTKHKEAAHPD